MESYQKILVLATCLLTVRLSNLRYSHVGNGEFVRWYNHSMVLTLPVNCDFENKVKTGDDLLQTLYWREQLKVSGAKGKDWSLVVLKKHFEPDLDELTGAK